MSNDIYAIQGRVKNRVAMNNMDLTPVGGALVNTHSMMLFDLHQLAETFPSPYKESLVGKLLAKESIPADLIKQNTPKEDNEDYEMPPSMSVLIHEDEDTFKQTVVIHDYQTTEEHIRTLSRSQTKGLAMRLMELYKRMKHVPRTE